jgi:hypothetical protein
MKRKEAILAAPIGSYLIRKKWVEEGLTMKIPISSDVKNNFEKRIKLTTEALNADDWEIVNE